MHPKILSDRFINIPLINTKPTINTKDLIYSEQKLGHELKYLKKGPSGAQLGHITHTETIVEHFHN